MATAAQRLFFNESTANKTVKAAGADSSTADDNGGFPQARVRAGGGNADGMLPSTDDSPLIETARKLEEGDADGLRVPLLEASGNRRVFRAEKPNVSTGRVLLHGLRFSMMSTGMRCDGVAHVVAPERQGTPLPRRRRLVGQRESTPFRINHTPQASTRSSVDEVTNDPPRLHAYVRNLFGHSIPLGACFQLAISAAIFSFLRRWRRQPSRVSGVSLFQRRSYTDYPAIVPHSAASACVAEV